MKRKLIPFIIGCWVSTNTYASGTYTTSSQSTNVHTVNTHTANAQALTSPPLAKSSENNQGQRKEPELVEETVVIGDRRGDFTIITEDAQKLVDVPGALGDPLQAVFSLPGIVADGDGGEPAVRGSSPQDNVYIADFLPTGYVFHDFSQSVFSEFILQDFQVYTAGFGPTYANVTGAAFDISLRDPKNQDFGGVADISLLRSGIFLESGVTDNSAFYLSARKSMIHLVVEEQTEDEAEDGVRIIQAPQDDDYQFKYVWDVTDNHKLSFSANGASDLVAAELDRELDFVASNPDFAGDAKIENTFDGQNVQYQYDNANDLIFRLAVGRSELEENTFWGNDYHSFISEDESLVKGELKYQVVKNHELTVGSLLVDNTFGLNYDGIIFICTEFEPDCSVARRERVTLDESLTVKETSVYANDTWSIGDSTWLDIGAQWYDNDFTDESLTLPRVALGIEATPTLTLKAKYGHYARLPNVEESYPGLGNPNLPTTKAKHTVFGLQKLHENGWSWNAEVYYKTLDDLPLAIVDENDDGDSYYTTGVTGKAAGLDILINKDLTDKWYGWLALSYGKSERTNTFTNETKDFYLDTPWMLSWVMKYEFKENMEIGWRWNIRSGAAYTPIERVVDNPYFEEEGAVIPEYGDPYSERLPTYSRLDIRYKWGFSMFSLDSELIVDVINLLNNENIEGRGLDYEKVEKEGDPVVTVDEEGLGLTPTVGLRIFF